MKRVVVLAVCWLVGGGSYWVCAAHENGPQCKAEFEFKGCSAEEIAAAKSDFCGGGERSVATTSTSSTSTTLQANVEGGFPTSCPLGAVENVVCRHYNLAHTIGFHCTADIEGMTIRCRGLGKLGLYGCRVPLS